MTENPDESRLWKIWHWMMTRRVCQVSSTSDHPLPARKLVDTRWSLFPTREVAASKVADTVVIVATTRESTRAFLLLVISSFTLVGGILFAAGTVRIASGDSEGWALMLFPLPILLFAISVTKAMTYWGYVTGLRRERKIVRDFTEQLAP